MEFSKTRFVPSLSILIIGIHKSKKKKNVFELRVTPPPCPHRLVSW